MLTIEMDEKDMFSFDKGDIGATLYIYREGADVKFFKAAMLKFDNKKQAIQLKDTLINLIEDMEND